MSDLIRRSDAIEAIEETDWYHINRDGDLVSGARSDGTALYKAGDVYKALNAVPTIDAVEVVRCKECRYKDTELCAMYRLVVAGVRKYDDYCSYGERKESE